MTIRLSNPHSPEALRDRIVQAVGTSFGDPLMLSAPYLVDIVELESVAAGQLHDPYPRAPRWQCLVGRTEPEAAVDLIEDEKDYVVVSINAGDLAPRISETVARAQNLAEDDDYELRGFEIPALHFAAVRLSGTRTEFFLPVPEPQTVELDLEPLRPYTAADLAERLALPARRVLDENP